MSDRTVQQVKDLIVADLSVVEKAHLIEWLGAGLRQELSTHASSQPHDTAEDDQHFATLNGANSFATVDEVEPHDDLPWEEQPWTEEEIRELMRPDPKTGAEIVAMLESGEVDTSVWAAMDIPDVVEWVKEQRRQEMQRRILQWAELE